MYIKHYKTTRLTSPSRPSTAACTTCAPSDVAATSGAASGAASGAGLGTTSMGWTAWRDFLELQPPIAPVWSSNQLLGELLQLSLWAKALNMAGRAQAFGLRLAVDVLCLQSKFESFQYVSMVWPFCTGDLSDSTVPTLKALKQQAKQNKTIKKTKKMAKKNKENGKNHSKKNRNHQTNKKPASLAALHFNTLAGSHGSRAATGRTFRIDLCSNNPHSGRSVCSE